MNILIDLRIKKGWSGKLVYRNSAKRADKRATTKTIGLTVTTEPVDWKREFKQIPTSSAISE
jgi:hypothetical protein